ncbi:MAG: beta-mannosidase [Bacteroidales bacterium]|nr:beta-mannosidase [Bacteroidales bacterium]
MRLVRTATLLAGTFLAACSTGNKKPVETPKDQVIQTLSAHVAKGEILYGHQDDLCYGHAWKVVDWETDSLTRSDVKAVTGKYPAIMGFELGGIEMGDKASLDSVDFNLIRKAVLTHAGRGGIVTISWHPRNPLTGSDAWDVSSDQVVKSLLEGGELHDLFMNQWLPRMGDFLESLEGTPVIFRPWHENTASWFWWGAKLCTAQEYKDLFRTTWTYLVQERGLTNLIWCYSPNSGCSPDEYMGRYPGDDVIDLLGLDHYAFMGPDGAEGAAERFTVELRRSLSFLQAFGIGHNKLICLSETGLEGLPDPKWWTEVLYPAVKGYPIAYLLTWRNACDKPTHFYAPWEGFVNAPDFKAFSELEDIIFLDN